MPSTRTTVAIFDIVCWTTPSDKPGAKANHHLARRGETIEVPESEYERLNALGAIGSAADLEVAQTRVEEGATLPDTQLDSSNADELVAYLGQHPTEAQRVIDLELSREERKVGKARKSVVAAAERVKAVYEAEIEERLEAERERAADEQAAYERSSGSGGSPAPTLPAAGS